jgi:PadR family transcriptional regulator, regulatory protein PadR
MIGEGISPANESSSASAWVHCGCLMLGGPGFVRYRSEAFVNGQSATPLAYRGQIVYDHLGNRGDCVSKPADLVQGTLDLLLLKILALEPLHGWAISQRLKQVSGDILQVSDGSLYPALHKLEQEGWITAEWKATENNRRAKFYSLTRLGRKQLQQEARNWERLSDAISHVVRMEEV